MRAFHEATVLVAVLQHGTSSNISHAAAFQTTRPSFVLQFPTAAQSLHFQFSPSSFSTSATICLCMCLSEGLCISWYLHSNSDQSQWHDHVYLTADRSSLLDPLLPLIPLVTLRAGLPLRRPSLVTSGCCDLGCLFMAAGPT